MEHGKAAFVERDSSVVDYGNTSSVQAIYKIENQTGPVFEGYMEITPMLIENATTVKEGFTGVISHDGTHAYIKEHIEGVVIADIIGPDTMLIYALYQQDNHGNNDPGITRAELTRVKT